MPVCSNAGLPPLPQLPLPPGLDSASVAPYQQKPIDLFKAIFEASDSDEENDDEEGAQNQDTEKKDDVDGGDQGGPLGTAGPAPSAQNSVRAAEQRTNTGGVQGRSISKSHSCMLPPALHAHQGWLQLPGMFRSMPDLSEVCWEAYSYTWRLIWLLLQTLQQ